jgi:site-specific recombinase XerD
MSTDLVPVESASADLMPRQSDGDAQLVDLWVNRSTSPNTRRNYQRQAARFLAFVGKPLGEVRLGDVQSYVSTLDDFAPASRALAVAAIKSLLSFAQETGFLRFNIGKVLKAPPVKNKLAERILSEADTLRMVQLEPRIRNRAILTLLYGAGLRISEVASLRRRDLSPRDDAGQVTVFGKGGKTRVVLLSAPTWRLLQAVPGTGGPDEPLFLSQKGGALDTSQVHRIIKAAAARAGLPEEISAHWLRHAHASHSLERGAPIHLVQATLGHASVATTGRYLHARPTDSSARYIAV